MGVLELKPEKPRLDFITVRYKYTGLSCNTKSGISMPVKKIHINHSHKKLYLFCRTKKI